MRVLAICAGVIAVALGGCSFLTSANLSRDAVIAQGGPGADVAYGVVKVDDAAIVNASSQGVLPGSAAAALGSTSSPSSAGLLSAAGGQSPTAAGLGFGVTPFGAPVQGVDASALSALRQAGVASGLPNLP